MKELSIYIHIPFCVRKCLYCDFLSFPVSGREEVYRREGVRMEGAMPVQETASGQAEGVCGVPFQAVAPLCGSAVSEEKIQNYVNLLKKEIIREAVKYQEHQVISVFWGGGTPSLLSGDIITDVMGLVRENYQVVEGAEITIEMNPGTADQEKLRQYIAAGINRLSIGLQSADDGELLRIGRIHDYQTFLRTYEGAREAGFRNINIDLMSALPGQSVASYGQTLRQVTALAPEHISAYSLILEEGTPLYERREEYFFPTEEEEQEMDRLTREVLSSCGYHRYEISNYAMEGYECRHNKVYWQRGDYAGFGLGASSMVGNVRWSNPAKMEQYRQYAECCPEQTMEQEYAHVAEETGEQAVIHVRERSAGWGTVQTAKQRQETVVEYNGARQLLTVQEQMEEYMFLGLRMVRGVSAENFAHTFGQSIETVYGDVLDGLYRRGLLVKEQDSIRLTERGMDVSNYAMAQFLFD